MSKSRVFSMRLSYSTIAGCYQLMEHAGISVTNKPVSRVVGDAVEALVRTTMKLYELTPKSDEEASAFLEKSELKLPGFETSDFINEVRQVPSSAPISSASQAPVEKPSVEEYLDRTASAIIDEEEAAILSAVQMDAIERVSPECEPECAKVAPWETPNMVSEEACAGDSLYEEAKGMNELMTLAVRATYFVLEKGSWSSDLAVEMVNKVYQSFKSYKEKYEKTNV